MVLKSWRLMPALRSRYCGMVWYLANSACHCASSSGGTTPVTGRHSTIDNPASVSRVAPPTIRVTSISAATSSSQTRTARAFRARALVIADHSLADDGADHIVMLAPSQSTSPFMPIRLRKLIGAVALVLLVTVWALVAMALAQSPAIKADGVVGG